MFTNVRIIFRGSKLMMTKKDYKRFAYLLNSMHHGFPDGMLNIDAKRFLVNNMCEIFESDNPNFSRTKFKEAVYAER
jgi:hypothetical protein